MWQTHSLRFKQQVPQSRIGVNHALLPSCNGDSEVFRVTFNLLKPAAVAVTF